MRLVRHDAELWSAEDELVWPFAPIRIPIRMTVLRLADGRLVLHSPIAIDAALRAELDALGPVGFVVVPQAHGAFAEAAAHAFPAAQLLAAPAAGKARRTLPFAGELADEPPAAWAGQIESHHVRGFRLNEVLLYQRATRTLLITDLCFNVHRSESAFGRWFFVADGMWRRFGRATSSAGSRSRTARRSAAPSSACWSGTSSASSSRTATSSSATGARRSGTRGASEVEIDSRP